MDLDEAMRKAWLGAVLQMESEGIDVAALADCAGKFIEAWEGVEFSLDELPDEDEV